MMNTIQLVLLSISSISLPLTKVFAQVTECPLYCRTGKNCDRPICQKNCQFSCGGTCDFGTKFYGNICKKSCQPSKCGSDICQGCLFCIGGGQPSTQEMCQLPQFVDITPSVYSEASSFNRWLHSGYPYPYYGPPFFADLNGDGLLDYFNPMHAHTLEVDGYDNRMELAQASVSTIGDNPKYIPLLNRINITDSTLASIDTHAANVVDLDGDGIVDIFISSGGGGGGSLSGDSRKLGDTQPELKNKNYFSRYNFLFWGSKTFNDETGEFELSFEGGRQTAFEAGVNMKFGRGRTSYVFDANGDGLLDIFVFQDRSSNNEVSPGRLLMNKGNRQWKQIIQMSEFTRAMLLTDADGDGLAQELLLSRGFCFPQRDGPGIDPNNSLWGAFTLRQKRFCQTRPVGSIAVYKYGEWSGTMKQIGPKYRFIRSEKEKQPPCCPHGSSSGSSDCHAISIASADFDGDLLADHVMLYQSKLVFYFSTGRPQGTVPSDKEHIGFEIYFPSYCDVAESLQIVDLDNDGSEEIVVTCRSISTFLTYTNTGTKDGWTLDNGCNSYGALGDATNAYLTTFNSTEMSRLCSEEGDDKTKTKYCSEYDNRGFVDASIAGMCLVDINNDGYLDLVTTYDFGLLKFYQSQPRVSNRFIAFTLEGDGVEINKYGIGATLILYARRSDDNRVIQQFREVSSYQNTADKMGCKEDRIIFGLGQNLSPIKVVVRWPNGKETTMWLFQWWEFNKFLTPLVIPYSNVTAKNLFQRGSR